MIPLRIRELAAFVMFALLLAFFRWAGAASFERINSELTSAIYAAGLFCFSLMMTRVMAEFAYTILNETPE